VHGCANAGSPTRRSDRAARSTSATAARALPRGRNVVERRFNKLKQWRGIAMRVHTDKTARTQHAGLFLAATLDWLTTGLSTPNSSHFAPASPGLHSRLIEIL
jgi:transposase